MGWRKHVRITVIKKYRKSEIDNEEVVSLDNNPWDDCGIIEEGQTFIVGDDGLCPKGFCSGAWADLYCRYRHLSLGGDFPWMKRKGTAVAACGDGYRPVVFFLERLEDDNKDE